jgi:hypothetical protein
MTKKEEELEFGDEGKYVYEVSLAEKTNDNYLYVGVEYMKMMEKEKSEVDFLNRIKNKFEEANETEIVELSLSLLAFSRGLINVEQEKFYRYSLHVDLSLSRVLNGEILRLEIERRKERRSDSLYHYWLKLLLWVCAEYLNFPYDVKKKELLGWKDFVLLNHCPHCMSVILNCVLDLLITFVELNKFDPELISILTAPLKEIEIERRNSYEGSNNCKVYEEIDYKEESLDSCYSSLLSYLMKLFTHFISLASPPFPSVSESSVYNPSHLIIGKSESSYDISYPKPFSCTTSGSTFIPIIPFKKIIILIEKLLLVTLTEERGFVTMPLNENFYRHSCLPQVYIMAEEIIDMRDIFFYNLKIFKKYGEEFVVDKSLGALRENCVKSTPKILLLLDNNGNTFQIYLPSVEIKIRYKLENIQKEKEINMGCLYRINDIRKKLNEFDYFKQNEYILYWNNVELKGTDFLSVLGLQHKTWVFDSIFIAFTGHRSSFYYQTLDFIPYKEKYKNVVVNVSEPLLSRLLLQTYEKTNLDKKICNDLSPLPKIESFLNICEYEYSVNSGNKYCTIMYVNK